MMSIQKIRKGLPEFVVLAPILNRWKEGDKIIEGCPYNNDVGHPQGIGSASGVSVVTAMEDVPNELIGKRIRKRYFAARFIPTEVLDNQAWQIATIGMDELQKINTFGEEMYRRFALQGNLYEQWLLDQLNHGLRVA